MSHQHPDPEIFGVVPPHATAWGMRRWPIGGTPTKLTAPREDGVDVEEWPLAELTVERVRELWGPGRYRAHWICAEADGRRRGAGPGRFFAITAQGSAATAEEGATAAPAPAPAPAAGLNAGDPLAVALALQQTIDGRAERAAQRDREWFARAAERDREFMAIVLQTTRPAPVAAPAADLGPIAAVLERMDRRLARLEALEADDADDAPAGAGRGVPFVRPGEPIGEAVTAAAVNGLIEHAPQLLGVAATMFGEWRESQKKAAEERAEMLRMLAARTAPPPPPAMPPPPPPPSVAEMARRDRVRWVEREEGPVPPSAAVNAG